MLAAVFISSGIDALRNPHEHAEAARPVLNAMAPTVDKAVEASPLGTRPGDETLVRADAGVKIVAGSLLALGVAPRLASTALAASLVPTTLARHRFWEETEPAARSAQQIHFLKNVGLFGGLLIASADTEGRPSLAWRGRRAADAVAERAAALGSTGKDVSGTVGNVAAGLAGLAPAVSAAISERAAKVDLPGVGGELADEWVERMQKARRRADKRVAKLQKRAAKQQASLRKQAARKRAELAKAAAQQRGVIEKKAPQVIDQLTKLGHDVAVRASTVGHEVAGQAEGVAKDTRKRLAAVSG